MSKNKNELDYPLLQRAHAYLIFGQTLGLERHFLADAPTLEAAIGKCDELVKDLSWLSSEDIFIVRQDTEERIVRVSRASARVPRELNTPELTL